MSFNNTVVSPLRPVKLPIGIVVILLADRSSTCKLDSSVAVNMVAGTDASWLFWRCTSVRDVRPENTLASRDASKLLFSLSDISDDSPLNIIFGRDVNTLLLKSRLSKEVKLAKLLIGSDDMDLLEQFITDTGAPAHAQTEHSEYTELEPDGVALNEADRDIDGDTLVDSEGDELTDAVLVELIAALEDAELDVDGDALTDAVLVVDGDGLTDVVVVVDGEELADALLVVLVAILGDAVMVVDGEELTDDVPVVDGDGLTDAVLVELIAALEDAELDVDRKSVV